MKWDRLLDEAAIAALLPVEYAHFAKPVCDGLAVFLEGLPQERQSQIFTQQVALSPTAEVSERLALLARSCPVLQKIGQVLARDQHLSPVLRRHLQELESHTPSVSWESIEATLRKEFGPLDKLDVTLTPPALAEASVAVVVPFVTNIGNAEQHGVFKILKPGIEETLDSELELLEQVGSHLDDRCDELKLPKLDYQDSFRLVKEKLSKEIQLDLEQEHLATAAEFYASDGRVKIPLLFDFCTPRITAMQRLWGAKVTDRKFASRDDSCRLAELIVDAMIAAPIFSQQSPAPFHSDPHAGNLMSTTDGRLAILDWSLVGWLRNSERNELVQLLLAAAMLDGPRILNAVKQLSFCGELDWVNLQSIISRGLNQISRGEFPGLRWLTRFLDDAVRDARLRLKPDLMLFRKTLYTLEGVVAELGSDPLVFDQVLSLQFVKSFMLEWPSRWHSLPNSREFATRLSNLDLARASLMAPLSARRFFRERVKDCLETFRLIKLEPV